MSKTVIKKHPLAIRWLHWVNFPLLAIMIWSGLLIYWANSIYNIHVGNKVVYHFFSKEFYKTLGVPFRLAEGMALHFTFMWLFFINGVVYVIYLLISKEYKLIFPNKKSLKESFQVVLHDLHIRRGLPPQKKYNAAQRIAYTGVIIMGFFMIITGLAIYKPAQLHWLTAICGGYGWARVEHFIITILFLLFFVVHVVQVIIAGWRNFSSMITGIEVIPSKKKAEITNAESTIVQREL